jgi:hypothetical protein
MNFAAKNGTLAAMPPPQWVTCCSGLTQVDQHPPDLLGDLKVLSAL